MSKKRKNRKNAIPADSSPVPKEKQKEGNRKEPEIRPVQEQSEKQERYSLPNAEIPDGPLYKKWINYTSRILRASPEKKQQSKIIVIGGGLAACASAAALAEQGYKVRLITSLESPCHESTSHLRGGLNASRNYANDGDSDERFFLDTMEYGAWQAREAEVYRMAQLSGRILDICTALCVPFIREEGGLLLPRCNPGEDTARSFQARGQTGRQLLLAFYSTLLRQSAKGNVIITGRREITEIVMEEGKACGAIARNKINSNEEAYAADAVVLASGGYADLYNSTPNHMAGGINALWAAYNAGAAFANPCFSLSLRGNETKWGKVSADYNYAQRCPGGLWVNYRLETTIPGLFAIGEANFSVHGANCMPGNAPLQELADGLLILPSTIGAYIARKDYPAIPENSQCFAKAISHSKRKKQRLLSTDGKIPPHHFHSRMAGLMREKAGAIRYSFSLRQALQEIRGMRKDFYSDLYMPKSTFYNTCYEIAYKTANYLDFAELLIKDAILRKETCGAHFRMDHSASEDKDENTHYIRAWRRTRNRQDIPSKENLVFSEQNMPHMQKKQDISQHKKKKKNNSHH